MISPHELPGDLAGIVATLRAASKEAEDLVASIAPNLLDTRSNTGGWSIAQCLDHLARTNRAYSTAMREAAVRAIHLQNKPRTHEVRPGWLSRWFIRKLEPPVIQRMKAPAKIVPAPNLDGQIALREFVRSQNAIIDLLTECKDLDLNGIRFTNPFIGGIRFSLGAGFLIIAAHDRRHLWQAGRLAVEFGTAMASSKG